MEQPAYNPYAPQPAMPQMPQPSMQQQPMPQTMPQPGVPGANPYAATNPYGQNPFNNQAQGPKKLSIPTWLVWLIGIGFVGLCGFLIWYLYF